MGQNLLNPSNMSDGTPGTRIPSSSDQQNLDFPTHADDADLLGQNSQLKKSGRSESQNAKSFVDKAKFGVVDTDEVQDEDVLQEIGDKTPTTAKRVAMEAQAK